MDKIDRAMGCIVGDARKRLLENHKGETCVVDGHTFCQEGYCSECAIACPGHDPEEEVLEFPKGCPYRA